MSLRTLATSWVDGCRLLVAYQEVPGYRRLPWPERKRLDHAAAAAIFCSMPFWRGVFTLGVVVLAMHIVIWRNDLIGPAADLLRGAPFVLSMPWLASARRRQLLVRIRFRDVPHRQACVKRAE